MNTTTTIETPAIRIAHGSHEPPKDPTDPTKVEACAMEHMYLKWALAEGWDAQKIIANWSDNLACARPPQFGPS